MLPGANGMGIAQRHRLSCGKGAHHVRDQPIPRVVPAADDVARSCRHNRDTRLRQKAGSP